MMDSIKFFFILCHVHQNHRSLFESGFFIVFCCCCLDCGCFVNVGCLGHRHDIYVHASLFSSPTVTVVKLHLALWSGSTHRSIGNVWKLFKMCKHWDECICKRWHLCPSLQYNANGKEQKRKNWNWKKTHTEAEWDWKAKLAMNKDMKCEKKEEIIITECSLKRNIC